MAKPINEVMAQAIAATCHKHSFQQHQIIIDWPKIVGTQLATITAPVKIAFTPRRRTDGTLYISTSNPAFILELQMQQHYIIQRVNTYFGYAAISKIRFIYAAN